MDIVFWPHTRNKNVASYRLRCLQIVETLKSKNVSVTYYNSFVKPRVLVLSKRYDEKSLDVAIKLRDTYGTKIVVDLCDNHFYSENDSTFWLKRAEMLRNAVIKADLVICSSKPLADVVATEVHKHIRVEVIGDFIEYPFLPTGLKKFFHPSSELSIFAYENRLKSLNIADGRRLVWFGNHGSSNASGGIDDILLIKSELESHHKKQQLSLTIISNNKNKYDNIARALSIPTIYVEWNKYTFSRIMLSNDIALLPISINPFTKCKTNNRLATAISHNLQVAATSIPSYEEFVNCVLLDDWAAGLEGYMNNQSVRESQNKLAQQKIDKDYSLSVIADAWENCLSALYKH